jgi:hypothetical protein
VIITYRLKYTSAAHFACLRDRAAFASISCCFAAFATLSTAVSAEASIIAGLPVPASGACITPVGDYRSSPRHSRLCSSEMHFRHVTAV